MTDKPTSLLGAWLNNIYPGGMSADQLASTHFFMSRIDRSLSTEPFIKTIQSVDSKVDLVKIKELLSSRGYAYAGVTYAENMLFYKGVFLGPGENEVFVPFSWLRVELRKNSFGVYGGGDPLEIAQINQLFTENFSDSGVLVSLAVKFRDKTLTTKDEVIEASPLTNPRQVFYPYIKQDLLDYYKQFMEARENVLILLGPPGTGKSTFLRGLITMGNNPAMLAYNKDVISSPELTETFYSSDSTILALEDCDAAIASRDTGNEIMAGLLNDSEGIIPRKRKKLVFSTNLPDINKIDPALLRAGRCFDVVHFRHLTLAEARAVELEMEMPQQNLVGEKWTLSQILNPVDENRQMPSRDRTGIGFR